MVLSLAYLNKSRHIVLLYALVCLSLCLDPAKSPVTLKCVRAKSVWTQDAQTGVKSLYEDLRI